ncbi:hypothetical protein [Streptomyces sp. CNQ085]|uniref:hypothetical protein n=1 Tax=Streptomyces sp. CNQ085 TaxID=2886944 RepID=UPI001F5134BA|nr:hypothetical protein [Streptomyces sp. CNQ085]MCI0386920.1 hypothetical protein [Streptomyces sp. CNQ085]
MTATTRRPAGAPEVPGATAPRAHCTADSAGGLSFDIELPGAAERWDAALLLRLRDHDPEESVRLPLEPLSGGPGGSVLRAVLPSTVLLAEGRWDAYLVIGEGEAQRLRPGCGDLRSLVDRVPRTDRTWLGVRIPYTTKYGNLSVCSWLRWPHAEAGDIWPADGGLTVHGRLYGAALTPTARLEARPRHTAASDGAQARSVTAPVTPAGTPAEGHGFTARLSYADLAGESGSEGDWRLWLRPGEDAEAVRVARILDDIVDKHRILRYPARPVTADEAGKADEPRGAAGGRSEPEAGRGLTARPYYTGANDLSVRLERTEPAGS